MDDTKVFVDRLKHIASDAERRNLDGVSAKIAGVIREVSARSTRLAAKDSTIEVESWPDFLNWWNNNRGQNLVYIFQDSYGNNTEQVRLVKKLVRDAEKHEKDLHELYNKLRDMASQRPNLEGAEGGPELDIDAPPAPPPQEEDEEVDPAQAEEAEDSALDEISLDL